MQWLSFLLRFPHVPFCKPMVIHCDNLGVVHIIANRILHACTKHIEVDYHFVRDLVVQGVQVQFVRSESQVANIFTKGAPAPTFLRHLSKLILVPNIRLRGHISEINIDCNKYLIIRLRVLYLLGFVIYLL